MRHALVALALLSTAKSEAQWQLLDPPTTADLRGIDNVGVGVAWASGTNGTVVRTEDGGYMWQHCSTPPGAEKLDFRGIQAFDENTAIVMSSGPGDQSRLYKTTDGCQSWTLLFTNPDPAGFWDAVKMIDATRGIIAGDPAKALSPVEAGYFTFRVRITSDAGKTWVPVVDPRAGATAGSGMWPFAGESLFAASNSSLIVAKGHIFIATSHARVIEKPLPQSFRGAGCAGSSDPFSMSCGIPWVDWVSAQLPILHDTPSSGIFSLASGHSATLVAVGGDYLKPNLATATAAFSQDDGKTWHASQTLPHGYRSAVAYDADHKTWITVGPNGTDISTDDGRNWTPLRPSAQEHDAPDADQHWNALSLPYVVGPHGRVGRLRDDALPESAKTKQPNP